LTPWGFWTAVAAGAMKPARARKVRAKLPADGRNKVISQNMEL